MTCVSCRAELDHCHGTVVRHADGGLECTAVDCASVDIGRHALLLDCVHVDGGCDCDHGHGADYADLPRAS